LFSPDPGNRSYNPPASRRALLQRQRPEIEADLSATSSANLAINTLPHTSAWCDAQVSAEKFYL